MKKTIITICTVVSLFSVFGQTSHTMYYMDAVPQRLSYNPAMTPKYGTYVTILMPSLGLSLYNDFSLTDILKKSEDGESYDLTPEGGITNTYTNFNFSYELLGVGFALKHGYVNFGVDLKMSTSLKLPYGGLFGFFTPNSINEVNFSLNDLNLEMSLLADAYVGYAHFLDDKWTFGTRLHYLQGLHAEGSLDGGIRSNVDELSLKLEGEYTLPLDDLDNLGNLVDLTTSTQGFSIDLGAVHKFNDEITFNASITRLGFLISDGYQTTVKDSGIVFNGFHPDNLSDFDVDELFKYGESTSEISYVTALSPLLFLGGTYQIIDRLKAGHVFSLNFGNRIDFTSSTSINYNVGRFINSSLAINMANYKAFSLGFGLSFNLSPIQLYLVTDDLISLASVTQLGSLRHANLRFGFNWVFKHKDKPSVLDKIDVNTLSL